MGNEDACSREKNTVSRYLIQASFCFVVIASFLNTFFRICSIITGTSVALSSSQRIKSKNQKTYQ